MFRKHGARSEEKDTMEDAVEGLAMKIITEDEERRAQELVSRGLALLVDLWRY